MSLDVLKNELRQWAQVETWHTNHPSDEKRFNQALNNVITKLGLHIHGSDLEEAIMTLTEETSPNMLQSEREKLVHSFLVKAENIISYLSDIKER